MTLVRIAFPVVIGAVLVAIGAQSLLGGLQSNGAQAVDAMRAAIPPLAIGAGLLLIGLAIARRLLLGRVLGLVVAALAVVAGLGIVTFELPYLGRGGPRSATRRLLTRLLPQRTRSEPRERKKEWYEPSADRA